MNKIILNEDKSSELDIDKFFDYHFRYSENKSAFINYTENRLLHMSPLLNKSSYVHYNSQYYKKSGYVINKIKSWLELKKEAMKKSSIEDNETETQFTRRRIALALYYMRKVNKFPNLFGIDTIDEKFYQFLTGRNTEYRKLISNPFKRPLAEKSGKATSRLINDLKIVKDIFEKIGFNDPIKLIDKKIDELNRDIDSFQN